MNSSLPAVLLLLMSTLLPSVSNAQAAPPAGTVAPRHSASPDSTPCDDCAAWNEVQRPFRIYGNSWYVGTRGLAAILITSPSGHVLIDGGLPQSASRIRASIEQAGFRMQDVKVILNSHAHYDHAGGIARLQEWSGAAVHAHPWSASYLAIGRAVDGDPQYGMEYPFRPVLRVKPLRDGEVVKAGAREVTAHFTGGHTPGGTSWTWRDCENGVCADLVYADSQTAVSHDDFLFTRNSSYPNALKDFDDGLRKIESVPCDILLTPHPGASSLLERVAARDAGNAAALIDKSACAKFVKNARERLAQRVERERR